MPPTQALTKHDLLVAIRAERAKLDELFALMDEARMLVPTRDDGWTAKDILAHISTWERRLLSWIERWRATGDPQRPEPGVTFAQGDMLNERDYLAAKNMSVATVRSEAAASYESVLGVVETLTDSELAARPDAPDGPSWSWIIGANTHEHYREHREEIEAWVNEHPV